VVFGRRMSFSDTQTILPSYFSTLEFFFFSIKFLVYLHTDKIQIMYNVSLHNISQVASNIVRLKPYKVRSFFLFFQTVIRIFSFRSFCLLSVILIPHSLSVFICLISVLCVLFYFNGTLITQMVMIRYDYFIISDYHLNQRPLRSIIRKIHH